ncbi:MAG: class I tRNA ligase family protein, partial [Acidobacteria bacterium]|nr:class I tRNA ligase family protein [Acidobacteriota bacterium]
YNLPTSVFVHGFLTVGGKKMSKTRGTFILARTYLDFLDPEHLRFYYASKLTGRADDLDLNLDDFAEKVNGELIHQVVNLPSRIGPLFDKLPGRHIGDMSDEGHRLFEEIAADLDSVETEYGRREYARAVRTILGMSSKANKYISDCKPWELARIEPETCRQVCCFGVHAVR